MKSVVTGPGAPASGYSVTAAEITDLQAFRMLRGNHVLELLPDIGPVKAAAIAAVRDFLEQREGRRVFAVYVGEDVAEDDAYEAISGHGVAAVVGPRAARGSPLGVDRNGRSTARAAGSRP